ncbi:MAG: hypothetical protein IIC73_05140, partial [Armatimonadetes bacterium]|nr:hypothetical protein [Armatimonadota bacterium]
MNENCQSEVGKLKSVLIKHARDAFVGESTIDEQWRGLNYTERPSFDLAVAEYDRFVALLSGFGIETHFLPQDQTVGLDSLYTRDASIICDKGAILCNMGKAARRTEPAAQETALRELGIPICGAIVGDGRVEGGDVVWIDERTLAVGRGYRTNDEGIRQLRELLSDCIDELIVVPLPHYRGPGDVFHLMSIISPIDPILDHFKVTIDGIRRSVHVRAIGVYKSTPGFLFGRASVVLEVTILRKDNAVIVVEILSQLNDGTDSGKSYWASISISGSTATFRWHIRENGTSAFSEK